MNGRIERAVKAVKIYHFIYGFGEETQEYPPKAKPLAIGTERSQLLPATGSTLRQLTEPTRGPRLDQGFVQGRTTTLTKLDEHFLSLQTD